ncbi:hypothetical protein [Pseudomonas sp.]|uniref:hypothetical protein n=1 Tax=Pseudomonas sp. TaxID=306 RepID=UPI003BB76DE2
MNSEFSALISSGDLDESFNGGRVLTFRFYEGEIGAAFDVAIGPDRRIYLAGTVVGRFAIVVLNPDGSFVEDFAVNGILLDSFFGAERSIGYRIAVDDQKVRILGTTEVSRNGVKRYCPAIASYDLSGVLDTAYGSGGYQVIDPDFEDGDPRFMRNQWAPNWSVANGKTYVAAFRFADGASSVLTCLDATGQFDLTFADAGTMSIKHPRGAQLESVRATAEGIYMAGTLVDAGLSAGAICRVSLRGEVDTNYGENGLIIFEGAYSEVNSLPGTGHSSLLTVGRHARFEEGETFIRHRGALRRFMADGSADKQFNNGDPVFTEINFSTGWYHGAVQGDGRILALGYASDPRGSVVQRSRGILTPVRYNEMSENMASPSPRYVLCRFLSDGSLDSSFGREHKGWISFNINENAVTQGIAVQPDNAVVVVGSTGDGRAYAVRFKG